MKPACTDAIGFNRTNLTAQAGNDHDIRNDSGTGRSEPAQHPIPTVSADSERQELALPALLFPPQPELASQFAFSAPPRQLSASQPVLRRLEAAESAHGSGDGQTDAPGSLALHEPCLTPGQGSEPGTFQAALDKDYRNELSAWVESAGPSGRAAHLEAERKINAYLDEPAGQGRSIDLSGLNLSTLHPLPADLVTLRVRNTNLSALPEHLPRGLQELDISYNQLTALPGHLPDGLQELYVSGNRLTALPENLPQGLQQLNVSDNKLTALSKNLPQGVQQLNVSNNELTALPEHLPPDLQGLYVGINKLTALPEHLPQGLQKLYVHNNHLTALPEHLPQGLQKLGVGYNRLTVLPKHMPQNLKSLFIKGNGFKSETLTSLMRSNTSITELDFNLHCVDAGARQEIAAELVNNMEHLARLANAAVTLDLLTRLAFTTSDQTGALIKRDSTPSPVVGGLPEQFSPAELHDVLAAKCPKDVLAVLAGMVDGTAQ